MDKCALVLTQAKRSDDIVERTTDLLKQCRNKLSKRSTSLACHELRSWNGLNLLGGAPDSCSDGPDVGPVFLGRMVLLRFRAGGGDGGCCLVCMAR